MKGVYQHCSERHLHRYLSEFDFRYSNRIRLGVDDVERTERALMGIVGNGLPIKRLISERPYGNGPWARPSAFRGNRVSDIIRQRRDVSADTAIRLAGYFGTDPRFWLNLQAAHNLSKAEREHDYSGLARRANGVPA